MPNSRLLFCSLFKCNPLFQGARSIVSTLWQDSTRRHVCRRQVIVVQKFLTCGRSCRKMDRWVSRVWLWSPCRIKSHFYWWNKIWKRVQYNLYNDPSTACNVFFFPCAKWTWAVFSVSFLLLGRTTQSTWVMGSTCQRRATSLWLITCGSCWRGVWHSCLSCCRTGETWTPRIPRAVFSPASDGFHIIQGWLKICILHKFSFCIEKMLLLVLCRSVNSLIQV